MRTEEERRKAEKRLIRRQEQRKRKLEEAGIRYDFEAVAYVSAFLGFGVWRLRSLYCQKKRQADA